MSPTSAIRIRSNFVDQGHREVFAPASATRSSIFSGDADLRRPFVLGPVPRRQPHGAHSAQRSCAVVVAPAKSRAGPAARSAGTERVSQLDCAPRAIRGPNLGSLSSGEFQMPGRVKCPSCLKFVGALLATMMRWRGSFPPGRDVCCDTSPLRGGVVSARVVLAPLLDHSRFYTGTGGASRAQSSLQPGCQLYATSKCCCSA